jgi:hypothetical protein
MLEIRIELCKTLSVLHPAGSVCFLLSCGIKSVKFRNMPKLSFAVCFGQIPTGGAVEPPEKLLLSFQGSGAILHSSCMKRIGQAAARQA